MKLWHVVQYGNYKTRDANEADTNCIVRANTLEEAVELGNFAISEHNAHEWRKDKADVIHLLGDDNHPDPVAAIVIRGWIQSDLCMIGYDSWYYEYFKDNGKWLTKEEFLSRRLKMLDYKLYSNEVIVAKAKTVRNDMLRACIDIGKAVDRLEEDPKNETLKLALRDLLEMWETKNQ